MSILLYVLIRTLHSSYRYRYDGREVIQDMNGKNFILAVWHQNLLAGIMAQTGKTHVVIISKSKDAAPVSYICKKLGHITKLGSSRKKEVDKGGKAAKDGMIEVLNNGVPGAVTVDGPKGPAFIVKPGIIDMARKANADIIPYALSFSSFWEFKSWDKFRLPKPFSKILVSYGQPIQITNNEESFEQHRSDVEAGLKEQTMKVDSRIKNWNQYSRNNWYKVS